MIFYMPAYLDSFFCFFVNFFNPEIVVRFCYRASFIDILSRILKQISLCRIYTWTVFTWVSLTKLKYKLLKLAERTEIPPILLYQVLCLWVNDLHRNYLLFTGVWIMMMTTGLNDIWCFNIIFQWIFSVSDVLCFY